MPEISDELLDRQMAYIEQICEEHTIPIDEAIEHIKKEYKEVSEVPLYAKLPAIRLFRKAFGKVCAILGNTSGEKYNILILAYSEPRDWNQQDREAILDAWGKGPKARNNLIQNNQVITMKKEGKNVVVSKIHQAQRADDGTFVVISGKEIEEGELPIPKDNEEFYSNGTTKNNNYTCPLGESWNINIWGLAAFQDGFKRFTASIYGDMANPNKETFLPAVAPPFGVYKGVFGVNEDKSSKDLIYFNYIDAIQKDEDFKEPIETEIYSLIEKGHILSYKEVKGSLTEEDKEKYFLVDLDDIDDFHNEVIAKRDENGDIIKGSTGWDRTNWDRFGMGVYYLTKATKTKKGNLSLRFSDWTDGRNGGFSNVITEQTEIDPNTLPEEYLVAFSTTRKPTRWDSENKEAVPDPINGDVVFNRILGLRRATNPLLSD